MARSSTTIKKGQVLNRTGRPKKGESLTEMMRQYLEEVPPGEDISYKEAFIKKVFRVAYEKEDPAFVKLIWNYLEGMPKQQVEHSGKMSLEQFLMAEDEEQ